MQRSPGRNDMPMSRPFREAADRFAWSAWGELGVPSTERRVFDLAIDMEALIHLTDVVADQDPRLVSHAAAWRHAFPGLISKARMKRIGDGDPPSTSGNDRTRAMSGPPAAILSSAPAVQLRLRAVLGVSARAELVRQFVLDAPGMRRSSSDLAQLAGYTKRNTEKALLSLEQGGWVVRVEGRTSLLWSLADHGALADLFAPLPTSNTSFLSLAEIIEELLVLDQYTSDSLPVRSAAARGVLAEVRSAADWGSVDLPRCSPDSDAWQAALQWIDDLPASAI